jgi:ATP-binding cassette subfamily F protein 3
MLSVEHIFKRFGDHEVLRDVTFHIGDGEKVALVGANGCGKSTLLRIVVGVEPADAGSIGGDAIRAGIRYLPQGSAEQEVHSAAGCMPVHGELWRLGRSLTGGTAGSPEETLQDLDAFEALGSWPAFLDLEQVLRGLGVEYLDPTEPYQHLSGGERTKLGLADLLLAPGPMLLLDEPSNHLDLGALAWLEHFLAEFAGAILLVSHDRALIDVVADAVVEIDAETRTARRFAGGYSAYQAEQERLRLSQAEAYRRQQERIEQIESDIRRTKQRATRFDTASANDHWHRIGKKVARTAKVRERKLERLLDSEERIEKPKQSWQLKAEIAETGRSGDIVLEARSLRLSFGARLLLDDCSLLLRQGERAVLTGPNGSGKTSLLRLLLGQLAPDAGVIRLGANVVPRLSLTTAGVRRPDAHADRGDTRGSSDG